VAFPSKPPAAYEISASSAVNLVDANGHLDQHGILKTSINTGFLRTPMDDFACLSQDLLSKDKAACNAPPLLLGARYNADQNFLLLAK
jgi:hypothetical protein